MKRLGSIAMNNPYSLRAEWHGTEMAWNNPLSSQDRITLPFTWLLLLVDGVPYQLMKSVIVDRHES